MTSIAPRFVEHGDLNTVCTFNASSIWKYPEVEASFAIINFDYPVCHTHKDYCEILFVYSGEITNFIGNESRAMKAGDCCIIHRDDKHKFYCGVGKEDNFVAINFLIRFEYFERLKYMFGEEMSSIFETPNSMKFFHIDSTTRDSVYNKVLLLQTPNDDYFKKNEFACKVIISELMKKYASDRICQVENADVPSWLSKLLVEIQKPENAHKKSSDFISEVKYSYSYVAKEFKKHMNCSFLKYLTVVKLNYAKDLLIHTNLTILDISAKLGFNSLSHFNHIFKETFGAPPSSFRKS